MAGGLPLVECGPPAAAADSLVLRLFQVRASQADPTLARVSF